MPSGLAHLPEVAASKDASLRSRKGDGSGKESSNSGSKYIQKVSSAAEVHDPRLSLDGIRKALPKSVFVKSLRRSIQWMLFDYLMVAASFFISHRIYAMDLAEIRGSDFALSCFLLPLLKIAMLIPCYMVGGFFMWGLFVVGHDCGHGSFSTSENYNFGFGLLTHGSILVPFTPWQRSHRFHHLKHNHVTDDYSYPWKHDPKYDVLTEPEKWHAQQPAILSVVYPIVAYAFYLVMPKTPWGVDGSHYMPALFKGDRMWKGIEWPELMRSWVSVAVCIGYVWLFATHVFRGDGVFGASGQTDYSTFLPLYVPAWFVFSFMLFTVTYLQHHSPETKIYDDSTWSYVTAGFETVDRRYGRLNPLAGLNDKLFAGVVPAWVLQFMNLDVDVLHHHISDGHVVHHLFFTKIPHYNLKEATDAMVTYLKENGMGDLYQFEETPDFAIRVVRYMYEFQSRAKLVTTKDM